MESEYYPEPYWLHGYPPDYALTHDVYYDDDYWRWVRYRKPVVGLLHIEQRAKELQAEAEAERLEAERREEDKPPVKLAGLSANPAPPRASRKHMTCEAAVELEGRDS